MMVIPEFNPVFIAEYLTQALRPLRLQRLA